MRGWSGDGNEHACMSAWGRERERIKECEEGLQFFMGMHRWLQSQLSGVERETVQFGTHKITHLTHEVTNSARAGTVWKTQGDPPHVHVTNSARAGVNWSTEAHPPRAHT